MDHRMDTDMDTDTALIHHLAAPIHPTLTSRPETAIRCILGCYRDTAESSRIDFPEVHRIFLWYLFSWLARHSE